MAETKNDPEKKTQTLTQSGLEPNIAALLAYLFLGVGGLVLYLTEKENKFVRFAAMQSIIFAIAIVAFQIIYSVLIGPLWLFGLSFIIRLSAWAISLGILALWIILMVKAYNGEEWELPILGKIARDVIK